MNKFLRANTLLEEYMQELGFKLENTSSLQLHPITQEQKSKSSGVWNNEVFNLDAFTELQGILMDQGFKPDPNPMDSSLGYRMHHLKLPSCAIRLYIKVEMSKEDECAKLKARLAELGCHY